MMHKDSARAAVFGATGYTGQEMVALITRHPGLTLEYATSESSAGSPVAGSPLRYVRASDVPLDEVDIVFTCLPHGQAEAWSMLAHSAGVKVVDLSSDLRDGRHGAVYGLTELWRDSVRGATLVANPGCYPTGVLLALAPLLEAGLIGSGRPIVVDAASGVTGAGRTARQDLLFGEVAEDFRVYGAGNVHRHVPEMARGLETFADDVVEFVFTPHLLPVRRGILETMYIPLSTGTGVADVRRTWLDWYAAEPFVDVWTDGLPTLRSTVQRNTVALGVTGVAGVAAPLAIVVASFDNLIKGAAGQALQNANLMLGRSEQEGLPV